MKKDTRPFYTGVGSRKTPNSILKEMTSLARTLDKSYRLRSGHADGADIAFESGATHPEIWIPWPRFNGSSSNLLPNKEAFYIARQHTSSWNSLDDSVQRLFARNVHQVLGAALNTPSMFLVCWTPSGKVVGGTAIAIKVAMSRDIPIRNLFDTEPDQVISEFVQTRNR